MPPKPSDLSLNPGIFGRREVTLKSGPLDSACMLRAAYVHHHHARAHTHAHTHKYTHVHIYAHVCTTRMHTHTQIIITSNFDGLKENGPPKSDTTGGCGLVGGSVSLWR